MPGEINSDSVIWNIGTYASGINAEGEAIAVDSIVVDKDTFTTSSVDALYDKLSASGYLPAN